MKVYNNNQFYKSPAGDQLWNSGRQDWIFGRIGDQEGAISDPAWCSNLGGIPTKKSSRATLNQFDHSTMT